MRIPVKEAKGKIEVGDYVRTNANGSAIMDKIVEGIVGEVEDFGFYIWHNDSNFDGARGDKKPADLGYKYSWWVGFDNEKAWVELAHKHKGQKIINKIMNLPRTLKRVLNKNLRDLYKAGYIDGELELTEKGRDVLFSILLEEYEDKLVQEAREELKENKEE